MWPDGEGKAKRNEGARGRGSGGDLRIPAAGGRKAVP